MQRGSVLRQVVRRVDWIPVGDRWCRLSIMGTDLSPEALDREPRNEEGKDNRTVIVMIPGNPGNEGFYAEFGERLLKNLMSRDERMGTNVNRTYLFYTISHLNHVKLPPELDCNAGNMKVSDRFLLEEQIQHKLDFMKEYIPKAGRVYLMGHSIGAYMMLKILPYVVVDFNIRAAIGLFPTIERMAESPNGIRLRRVLAALDSNDWLAKTLTFWLDFLPVSVKKWLVGLNLRGPLVPPNVIESASELLNMHVFRNIVHMSHDELETVCELDKSLLKEKELVHLLYGTIDGWVPTGYGEEMAERLGSGHVHMDDNECEHAFVIRDSKLVAEKILPLIA